jgi:hypothetical protein
VTVIGQLAWLVVTGAASVGATAGAAVPVACPLVRRTTTTAGGSVAAAGAAARGGLAMAATSPSAAVALTPAATMRPPIAA